MKVLFKTFYKTFQRRAIFCLILERGTKYALKSLIFWIPILYKFVLLDNFETTYEQRLWWVSTCAPDIKLWLIRATHCNNCVALLYQINFIVCKEFKSLQKWIIRGNYERILVNSHNSFALRPVESYLTPQDNVDGSSKTFKSAPFSRKLNF